MGQRGPSAADRYRRNKWIGEAVIVGFASPPWEAEVTGLAQPLLPASINSRIVITSLDFIIGHLSRQTGVRQTSVWIGVPVIVG